MASGFHPVVYVIPQYGSPLDGATTGVVGEFVRAAFTVIGHNGVVDLPHVANGLRVANAHCILLASGISHQAVRSLTWGLRDTVEYVIAVGHCSADEREGDPAEPFRMHPDEGPERLAYVVEFIRKGLEGAMREKP